jgi:hypothetical protein
MRRVWASVLIAVLGFTLMGTAAFAPSGERTLPPCCRSNGKHHCAMAQSDSSSSGAAFRVGRCPLFGSGQTMPPVSPAGVVKLTQTVFAIVISRPALRPQTDTLSRRCFDRSAQKRGPPFLS